METGTFFLSATVYVNFIFFYFVFLANTTQCTHIITLVTMVTWCSILVVKYILNWTALHLWCAVIRVYIDDITHVLSAQVEYLVDWYSLRTKAGDSAKWYCTRLLFRHVPRQEWPRQLSLYTVPLTQLVTHMSLLNWGREMKVFSCTPLLSNTVGGHKQ